MYTIQDILSIQKENVSLREALAQLRRSTAEEMAKIKVEKYYYSGGEVFIYLFIYGHAG